jgi:enoyl-CoA hydratase
MATATLHFSEINGIGTITVQRPDALNALNLQVVTELGELLSQVEKSKTLRCLILTGQGEKAFVAGADIKEIDQLSLADAKTFAQRGQQTFSRIEELHVPVIAAVNGFALGGGLELALACDFIVAAETAKFGLPECTLGIMPGFGGTVRLPRRVGVARAKEISMTGTFISAAEALAMGLVNKVAPAAQLLEASMQLAQTISSRAPRAIAAIKKSVHEGQSLTVDKALELEAQLFADLFKTTDQKEGTRAFIEKRKPVFKGE